MARRCKTVIGVDPDSKAHGMAIYRDGQLTELCQMYLVDIFGALDHDPEFRGALWIVEDVNANKFIYSRNTKSGPLGLRIAQDVGKVKQAQIELVRALESYGVEHKLVKPQKGNWAKNKKQFERVTGWKQRSNEDTRSAAYFGWLYAKKN